VSYAHEDTAQVYPELLWLRDQGFNIWYDEGISPGVEWDEEIGQAIDGAAQVMFFVTPASTASTHCKNEIQFAISHQKPILAIHLQPTELTFGLELSLGGRQAILKYECSASAYRDKLLASMDPGQFPVVTRYAFGRSRLQLLKNCRNASIA
jgi:hypothetical protein